MSRRARRLLLAFAVALGAPLAPARADGPPPTPAVNEVARREVIERLGRNLKKDASSPRAEKLREEIVKDLEALEALDGADAARAALEALAFDDDAGIAHWHAEFTTLPAEHHVALDGILMATLDAEGRCTDLREWWHRVEEHVT